MKQLKYLSLFLFAIILSAGFSSCGDDDDSVIIDKETLIGSWNILCADGYKRTDSNQWAGITYDFVANADATIFNVDGTLQGSGVLTSVYDSWKIVRNKLILSNNNETISCTILELTPELMRIKAEITRSYAKDKYELLRIEERYRKVIE